MKRFPIDNKQVKEIYERNYRIFSNVELEESTRISAYTRMNLIQALVEIYEGTGVLDEEDLDDLFIAYGPKIKPVFPEQYPKILENIKKNLPETLNRLKKHHENNQNK